METRTKELLVEFVVVLIAGAIGGAIGYALHERLAKHAPVPEAPKPAEAPKEAAAA